MIRVEHLSVRAGDFVLREAAFAVNRGEHAFLMGRTGSGKTTLLEAICGLRPVIAGRVLLDGREVTSSPPAQRGIGFVPQDAALFTHLPSANNSVLRSPSGGGRQMKSPRASRNWPAGFRFSRCSTVGRSA